MGYSGIELVIVGLIGFLWVVEGLPWVLMGCSGL